MTAEQLQRARATHWRQQNNPILTLDDASGWLEQHPLCLYLPRRAQLPAPAPTFVEAVLGMPAATPGPDAIAAVQALLTRLIASGEVVALNLFGVAGEQPDFLVTRKALPYVLCLRADADWKHAPQKSFGHKVSPLVLELWKALDKKDDKDGALTAPEARETLGRELTEAAVLRGLSELWQGLRVAPVFEEPGQPARWELLRVKHRAALATAGATGQVTALSLLVSIYLQSVYAASSEEIEIFLSPLASRSRVREAVRGLSATRQIHSLSMDAQTYYFLEGGLPESAVDSVAATPPAAPPAVRFSAPRRPLPGKDQGTRPAAASMEGTSRPGKEWKKPRGEEKSATARPAFPPNRSLPPAPGFSPKLNRGPQRNDRGGMAPKPSQGRETRPARPEVSREWRKPPRPGKPAGRYSPSPRNVPPASAYEAGKTPANTPRGSQSGEAPARTGSKRFERPARGARFGPKPPFRSPERPRSSRPNDRPGNRTFDRPDRRRTAEPVSGRPAGTAPPTGRPSRSSPASFRSKPGRTAPGKTGPGKTGPGRTGSGKTGSGGFGPRRRDGRPGGQTGGPRTGYSAGRPPRSSPPRDGESQAARPPFVPSARPAKPSQRTSSTSFRPAGKRQGRFGGRPGAKPGGQAANFERRKPTRKKPGA